MKTSILSKHREVDETLKRYISQRIQAVLSQLTTQVNQVVVKLGADNSSLEGPVKHCDIEIVIGDHPVITIQGRRSHWLAAIDHAIEHAAKAVRRITAKLKRDSKRKASIIPLQLKPQS